MTARSWSLAVAVLAVAVGGGIAVGRLYPTRGGPAALSSSNVATTAPAPVVPLEGITFSTADQPPQTTPDLLPAGVPLIHGWYRFADPPAETLQASLRRDGKPAGPDVAVTVQPDANAPGSGTVALRSSSGKFLPGVYELQVGESRKKLHASFLVAMEAPQILAQPVPAEAVLKVGQHCVALGVSPKGEPAKAVTEVGTRDRVYFAMRYEGAEPGMAVSVSWWAGAVELKGARREITLPATAGWANAWIQAAEGLPPGPYTVVATTAGGAQELARDQFTVR